MHSVAKTSSCDFVLPHNTMFKSWRSTVMVSSYGISKGYVGRTVDSRNASKARRVRDLKPSHKPYSCKRLQATTCRVSTGQGSETKASSYNSTSKVLCRRDALTAVVMAFTSASGVHSATAGASISEIVPPQASGVHKQSEVTFNFHLLPGSFPFAPKRLRRHEWKP